MRFEIELRTKESNLASKLTVLLELHNLHGEATGPLQLPRDESFRRIARARKAESRRRENDPAKVHGSRPVRRVPHNAEGDDHRRAQERRARGERRTHRLPGGAQLDQIRRQK